jgi:hypothetical protein
MTGAGEARICACFTHHPNPINQHNLPPISDRPCPKEIKFVGEMLIVREGRPPVAPTPYSNWLEPQVTALEVAGSAPATRACKGGNEVIARHRGARERNVRRSRRTGRCP